jgi:hypothetical protein
MHHVYQRKVQIDQLPPVKGGGGGGNSLNTFSICMELSQLTIRATKPSSISPCTFM